MIRLLRRLLDGLMEARQRKADQIVRYYSNVRGL